jgi:hypothetical protein
MVRVISGIETEPLLSESEANQVHVIRHRDSGIEFILPAVCAKARLEGETSCNIRQYPAMPGRVSYEENPAIFLMMRQAAAIVILPLHRSRVAGKDARGRVARAHTAIS